MSERTVETTLLVDANRHLPLKMFTERSQAFEAAGCVDQVMVTDQLTSWFPLEMWAPEYTGLAGLIPDVDSFPDPFAMAALHLAATEKIGVTLATDAIRRGPAEVMQSMLTLANLSGPGRPPILQMGAGERKQTKPFGYKRTQGLKRFEDQLRYIEAFWSTDGPVNLEGNHWSFAEAWIGRGGMSFAKPRVWALGGGPRLIDLATSYADGFATSVPSAWSTPEQAASAITAMRQDVERKGRDPEAFDIGIWSLHLLHPAGDTAIVEAALANKMVQWMCVIFGRFLHGTWEAEGFAPPIAADFHYAMQYEPIRWTVGQIEEVLSGVDPALYERSVFVGSPQDAAAQLKPWIEAGVNWVMPVDYGAFVLPPDQLEAAVGRTVELCGRLKQLVR